MKKALIILALVLLPSISNAQKGCCSHHGGVSGCNSNGHQLCSDGSFSPSCMCSYTPPAKTTPITETTPKAEAPTVTKTQQPSVLPTIKPVTDSKKSYSWIWWLTGISIVFVILGKSNLK